MPTQGALVSKAHPGGRTNAPFVVHIRQPLHPAQANTRYGSADGIRWIRRRRSVETVVQQEPDGVGRDVSALEVREDHHPGDFGGQVVWIGLDESYQTGDDGRLVRPVASLVVRDKERGSRVTLYEPVDQCGDIGGGCERFDGQVREKICMRGKRCENDIEVEFGLCDDESVERDR